MRRRSITFIERKLRAESRNTDCLVGMSIGAATTTCPVNQETAGMGTFPDLQLIKI